MGVALLGSVKELEEWGRIIVSPNAELHHIRAVAAILGADATVLLGDSATELALKQQQLHECRVIHFAVHGRVNEADVGSGETRSS